MQHSGLDFLRSVPKLPGNYARTSTLLTAEAVREADTSPLQLVLYSNAPVTLQPALRLLWSNFCHAIAPICRTLVLCLLLWQIPEINQLKDSGMKEMKGGRQEKEGGYGGKYVFWVTISKVSAHGQLLHDFGACEEAAHHNGDCSRGMCHLMVARK